MNIIAVTREYKDSLGQLDKRDSNRVKHLLIDLQDDIIPKSAHQELLKRSDGKILRSYRANDELRLILWKWRPNEWIAVACGHHDETYKRIERMQFGSDKKGVDNEMPIIEVVQKKIVEIKVLPAEQPSDPTASVDAQKSVVGYPFGQMEDANLIAIGVREEDLTRLRNISSEEDLLRFADEYPQRVSCRLLDIAEHPLNIQVYLNEEAEEAKAAETAEMASRRPIEEILATNPNDRANYFLLTDELLSQFFDGTLEDWEVFLHPSQTAAIEMKAYGPAMVTGSAGTGKTVVAVHRAKWLLEHGQNIGKNKILITTYVSTLVESIKAMLHKICTPEQCARIDVVTFDSILRDTWKKFRKGGQIEYDTAELVARFLDEHQIDLRGVYIGKRTTDFLAEEYEQVILEHDLQFLRDYKTVVRSGLLGRVDRETERPKLWPVFEMLNMHFSEEATVGRLTALNLLSRAIASRKFRMETKYHAIIVDEAQDFGAAEYRFLAAWTGNKINLSIPETLFICGDGHQGIYGRSGTLKECGINVVGRSRRLKVCYRSTKKIREYGERILRGVASKNPNGDVEVFGDDSSLEEGEPPIENFFDRGDYAGMNNLMIKTIRQWNGVGVHLSDIAVLMRQAGPFNRSERFLFGAANALAKGGIPVSVIDKDNTGLNDESVKVMTMHRAKGMQFHGVIIDLTHWPRHDKDVADYEQKAALLDQEKRLLYMAVMRATSRVVITGTHGRPKPDELPVEGQTELPLDYTSQPPQDFPATTSTIDSISQHPTKKDPRYSLSVHDVCEMFARPNGWKIACQWLLDHREGIPDSDKPGWATALSLSHVDELKAYLSGYNSALVWRKDPRSNGVRVRKTR